MFRALAVAATIAIALCLSGPASAVGEKPLMLEAAAATVFYPAGLEADALRVLDLYKDALASVEGKLGMRLKRRASIVLVKDSSLFMQASGSSDIVAFARGSDGLIVIDYRRALVEPFSLAGTLRHEAAHLILHEYAGTVLPRWLNEGLAQYVSDGPAEIALSRNASVLSGAALSDRLIPFERLEDDFPRRREGLVLAYEQSLSFVQFIAREYGERKLLDTIGLLNQGLSYREAISRATGTPYSELEDGWARRIRARASWISFLSDYFYELIFVLGALITLYAFARAFIRIKTYRDEPEESEPHPTHRFPFEEKQDGITPSQTEQDRKD